MKLFVCVCALISLPIWAQNTGSTPPFASIYFGVYGEGKYTELENNFLYKYRSCNPVPFKPEINFIEVTVNLQMHALFHNKSPTCYEDDPVLKCMVSDSELISMIASDDFGPYLMSKYQLDQEKVRSTQEFYRSLLKSK